MLTTPPLSLYVHLPWCVRKCPYCDFNSHAAKGALPIDAYVDALIQDLEFDLPLVWGRVVHSVFFGGGTPSLFPPAAIDRFLQQASARLRFAPDAEITLETNPGTVEHGPFAGYLAAGINRLSFGVQSFDDGCLQRLGRIHSSGDALRAVKAAQDALSPRKKRRRSSRVECDMGVLPVCRCVAAVLSMDVDQRWMAYSGESNATSNNERARSELLRPSLRSLSSMVFKVVLVAVDMPPANSSRFTSCTMPA